MTQDITLVDWILLEEHRDYPICLPPKEFFRSNEVELFSLETQQLTEYVTRGPWLLCPSAEVPGALLWFGK